MGGEIVRIEVVRIPKMARLLAFFPIQCSRQRSEGFGVLKQKENSTGVDVSSRINRFIQLLLMITVCSN